MEASNTVKQRATTAEQKAIVQEVLTYFTSKVVLTRLPIDDETHSVELRVVETLDEKGLQKNNKDIENIMERITLERNFAIAEAALKEVYFPINRDHPNSGMTLMPVNEQTLAYIAKTHITHFGHEADEETIRDVAESLILLYEEAQAAEEKTEEIERSQVQVQTDFDYAKRLIEKTTAPITAKKNYYRRWVAQTIASAGINIRTERVNQLAEIVVARRVRKAAEEIAAIMECPTLMLRTVVQEKVQQVLDKYRLNDQEGYLRKIVDAKTSSTVKPSKANKGNPTLKNNHSGGRSGSRSAFKPHNSRCRSNGTGRHTR